MAQLPPTGKPETACVYLRSRVMAASQSQKKGSQDEKNEKQKTKKIQLPARKDIHFGFLIGKMQGWDEIMKFLPALTCY